MDCNRNVDKKKKALSVNILLGVTGSVATIKVLKLLNAIKTKKETFFETVNIKVIATEKAKHFIERCERQCIDEDRRARNDQGQVNIEDQNILERTSTSDDFEIEEHRPESCSLSNASTDETPYINDHQQKRTNILNFEDLDFISDTDEWECWQGRGDMVLHVELARWADILLIAPCDCLTLSKFANAHCDNLLTCVFQAWQVHRNTVEHRSNDDPSTSWCPKPIMFCPAMNNNMWLKSSTQENLTKIGQILLCSTPGQVGWISSLLGDKGHKSNLRSDHLIIVPPISKSLMCGDFGVGAMAEVDTIVDKLFFTLHHTFVQNEVLSVSSGSLNNTGVNSRRSSESIPFESNFFLISSITCFVFVTALTTSLLS